MKIIITEEQKKKLFIPRKLSKDDSRYDEWNKSQPIKDGVRINQYDYDGLKQGYWEEYWDNGELHSKGSYKDGKREGYWEDYHDNGNIYSKGSYVDGKREGYWDTYYYNGELMSKGIYKDDERVRNLTESEKKKLFIPRKLSKSDHRWMDHNKSQPIVDGIRINQYDENGLKQGYWVDYHDNGQLYSKGNYKDDQRYGYWEFYYKNGELMFKGDFKDGKREGYFEEYYDNKQLHSKGNYIYSKREGYWEFYYRDGKLSYKGIYNNDQFVKYLNESKKNKLFIPRKLNKDDSRYDDWNNKQPIKDGVRINQYDYEGRKQGYWEDYWDNGKLHSKGSYVNGKKEGYWEGYYDNGQLWEKGIYKEGMMDGYWESYYSDGRLYSKGNYVNGKFLKKLTESEKKKLFIPRKLSKGDSRFDEHNKSQPIKNINGEDIRINQYDENGLKQGYWEKYWNNGELSSKGSYVDDMREGYWDEYGPQGQFLSKNKWEKSKLVTRYK